MRYQEGHKEDSRRRILDAAAKALRREGPEGVNVAAVMRGAGLTHGAFYAHFKSRTALIAAAMQNGMAQTDARVTARLAGREPRGALAAQLDHYLSPRHRDNPEIGCLLPSLCADAARKASPVRGNFTPAFEKLEGVVRGLLNAMGHAEPESMARSMVSEMVGAVALSRAISDKQVSDDILRASRDMLKRRAGLI